MCSAHKEQDDRALCADITWPTHQYLCVSLQRIIMDLENKKTERGLIRVVQNKN